MIKKVQKDERIATISIDSSLVNANCQFTKVKETLKVNTKEISKQNPLVENRVIKKRFGRSQDKGKISS